MTDKHRKFLGAILMVYSSALGVAFILSFISGILNDTSIIMVLGNVMLYGGVLVFILGFMIIGSSRGLHRRETVAQFAARRDREKPVELVAWAISMAGLLMTISGYLILSVVMPYI